MSRLRSNKNSNMCSFAQMGGVCVIVVSLSR